MMARPETEMLIRVSLDLSKRIEAQAARNLSSHGRETICVPRASTEAEQWAAV